MKTRLIYPWAIIAIMIASCQVMEDEVIIDQTLGDITFYASSGDNTAVRTVLEPDGSISWMPNEEINLFYGAGLSAKFISSNSEPSAEVEFKGSLEGLPTGHDSYFWAVYPFNDENTFDGESVELTLPDIQTAADGTFAPGSFPSIARTSDFQLRFFNICGGIKFSVAEDGVKSVIFKGNGDEPLAGKMSVKFDEEGKPTVINVLEPAGKVTLSAAEGESFKKGVWYYISALPGSLENGYTITLLKEDGTSAVRTSSNPVTIKRSVWGKLEGVDDGLEYKVRVPSNEIWYTTKSGNPVNFNNNTHLALSSNEYTDGMGKLVFIGDLKEICMYMFQSRDLASVKIPEGVTEIAYGAFSLCRNLVSVELPESLESIGDIAFDNCSSLTEIRLPKDLKSIGYCAFSETSLTTIDLPEGLETIGASAFYMCYGLSSVTIPSTVTAIGQHAFADCRNLKWIELLSPTPPECASDCFSDPYDWNNKDNYPIYVPEESAKVYAESYSFKDCVTRLFAKNGTSLLSMAYKSTDYSKDGEVVIMQEASAGRGINLVFVGDGFTDRDMAPGGRYEMAMRKGMEALFCWEPLKTFRDRFNVFAVKVVSSNDNYGWTGADRAFSHDVVGTNSYTEIHSSVGDVGKGFAYSRKVPNPYSIPQTIILLHNTDLVCARSHSTGTSEDLSGGSFNVIYKLSAIAHEFGHGFAGLSDEYLVYDHGVLTKDEKDEVDSAHLIGGWANLDYRNDPSTVSWARFIADPRYSYENLGAYQGAGFSSIELYRPTENSCMNMTNYPFNAPSREAIYKYIMKYSEGDTWTYDYETFVAADEAGREQWKSHTNPYGDLTILYQE